ncbi:MAG TPA: zinc-ribbon domain containing protein [Roseiflexaceae bacterium]|nr:zinc-ribbon domain containing protein [Roseiflexaceae bacterium]
MSYIDKQLICRECEAEFVWSAGEQAFFAEQGLKHAPTRCPKCRRNQHVSGVDAGIASSKKRAAAQAVKAERSARRKKIEAGTRSYPVVVEGERELYLVPCAACGREARVPFVPRGSKPVYCETCFQRQRSTR